MSSFVSPATTGNGRSVHALRHVVTEAALSEPLQAVADASGRAQVELGPVPAGATMEVERISLRVEDTTSIPIALVYIGDAQQRNVVDGTPEGDIAFADYPRGLRVPAGGKLTIEWREADADAVCTARLQYVRTAAIPSMEGNS